MSDQRILHPLFGEVRKYRQYFKNFIQYDVKCQTAKITTWENHLKEFADVEQKYILLPEKAEKNKAANNQITVTVQQEIQIHISFVVVQMKYGNYIYLLEDERRNRIDKWIPFENNELWYIMLGLLKAAREAMYSGFKLPHLSSSTVLLDQRGHLKVFCEWSVPEYQRCLSKSNQIRYRSPQEIYAGTNVILHNSAMSYLSYYSYAIGCIMLELATLRDIVPRPRSYRSSRISASLANNNNNNYLNAGEYLMPSRSDFDKLLKVVAMERGSFMANMIYQLIQEDPSKRMNPCEAYGLLKPYKKQIQDMQEWGVCSKKSWETLKKQLCKLEASKLI